MRNKSPLYSGNCIEGATANEGRYLVLNAVTFLVGQRRLFVCLNSNPLKEGGTYECRVKRYAKQSTISSTKN